MTIKILNEIAGTDLIRVEENHQISIRRKSDLKNNQVGLKDNQQDKSGFSASDEINLDSVEFPHKTADAFDTPCNHKFGLFYCQGCDNYVYCKSLEKRK